MLGRRYMTKKDFALAHYLLREPQHDTCFLPYLCQFKDIQEKYMGTIEYTEWSMQACPLDTANPAWYYRSPRESFKTWGKNQQK